MSNDLAIATRDAIPIHHDTPSAFGSIAAFENIQRMAKLLCGSTIVPESYRNNLADTVIALEMANRIGANPLAVMQNLYSVHGRPAWSSQFLISCVNASGKFTPLRYRSTGDKGTESWGCIAWAKDRSGEVLESPEITIGMAREEGWSSRNGSKWKTMPELMLRYRAATLFVRTYAPELTMGIHSDDEIVDIAPIVTEPSPRFNHLKTPDPKPNETAIKEAGHPKKRGRAKVVDDLSAEDPAPREEAPAPSEPAKTAGPRETITLKIEEAAVSFDDFRDWLVNSGVYAEAMSMATIEDLPLAKARQLIADDCKGLRKCITLYGRRTP